MTFKVTLIAVVLALATALPIEHQEHYGPPKHKKEPKPYSFSYGVKDDYRGTVFNQNEKSNGKEVHGSYTVQLPDGRKQTVNYKADHHNGFVADVSYYGEAKYPSKSPHPPFVVKPSKHHEPEPSYHKPEPSYHKPEPSYHKPEPSYHKPEPSYHKPEPSYHKPPVYHPKSSYH